MGELGEIGDILSPTEVICNKHGEKMLTLKFRHDWHHVIFQRWEENIETDDREKLKVVWVLLLDKARRVNYAVFDHKELAESLNSALQKMKKNLDEIKSGCSEDVSITMFNHATNSIVDLTIGVSIREKSEQR